MELTLPCPVLSPPPYHFLPPGTPTVPRLTFLGSFPTSANFIIPSFPLKEHNYISVHQILRQSQSCLCCEVTARSMVPISHRKSTRNILFNKRVHLPLASLCHTGLCKLRWPKKMSSLQGFQLQSLFNGKQYSIFQGQNKNRRLDGVSLP